MTILQLW